jgi:hypothetical protein
VAEDRLRVLVLVAGVLVAMTVALAPTRARVEAAIDSKGVSWGPVTEGFAVGVEFAPEPDEAAPLGGLRLTLVNVSREPLLIAEAYPEFDYTLTVTGPNGEVIAPRCEVRVAARNVLRMLDPGEEFVSEYDLGKTYELTQEGEYRIEARRPVGRLDGEGVRYVTSGPVYGVLSGGRLFPVVQETAQRGAEAGPTWSSAEAGIDSEGVSWGAVTEGFAVGAQLAPESDEATQLGRLRLVIVNVSQEPLLLAVAHPEYNYRLTVTGPDGKVVVPRFEVLNAWGNQLLVVKPGEELVSEYDLDRMYELTQEGEYRIEARRAVGRLDGEGGRYVTSGPVRVVLSGGRLYPVIRQTAQQGADAGPPRNESSIPMVVARDVLERQGYRVTWDPKERAAKASRGSVVVLIKADSPVMSFGGRSVAMGREAQLIDGRLCAPGNAISLLTASAAAPS